MTPQDRRDYPNLIALLDARRTLCKPCKYCGLVNAAWGTPAYTRDHPSCIRVAKKRIKALQQLRQQKEADRGKG